MPKWMFSLCLLVPLHAAEPVAADPKTYLREVEQACEVSWPANHMVNIVCFGHSVPAGYFKTPEVRSPEAYPALLRQALAKRFPHAVINVIVTAIGGENSEGGAARFQADVLDYHPAVVTIDYALNDRGIGLERSRKAWVRMIEMAREAKVKVILMTPTPDQSAKLDSAEDPLNQQAGQIRKLAAEYGTGLADSQKAFNGYVAGGGKLPEVMAQVNHPNAKGHELVLPELMKWFP